MMGIHYEESLDVHPPPNPFLGVPPAAKYANVQMNKYDHNKHGITRGIRP